MSYALGAITKVVEKLYGIINDNKSSVAEKDKAKRKLMLLWSDKDIKAQYEHEQKIFALKKEREQKLKDREENKLKEVMSMDLPLDYENLYSNDSKVQGVHFDNIPDALVSSIVNTGKVDLEYIAAVTGEEFKTIIKTLKGSIYQNPEKWNECFYKGWETAGEYLSGSLRRKYKIAQLENYKFRGWFDDNLKAIDAILTQNLTYKDIYVTLGSPWVDCKTIDEFISYLLGRPLERRYLDTSVKHDVYIGSWEIPNKSVYSLEPLSYNTYGTKRIDAIHIIERTLNMKNVVVTDEFPDPYDPYKTKRVINKAETAVALEKQKLIIDRFQNWVWRDETRKKRLMEIYEEKYGSYRRRRFCGSFLTFPNLNKDISLYEYQKNAIARIIFSPNTLLAHDVGAGKTYVMIVAGMELKRMGLSKKNLYVVPNNIVGQWENIFKSLYPNAKVLTVSPESFKPEKRDSVLVDIMDNDYDGIIMAYSCFDMIPLSFNYYKEQLAEQLSMLDKMTEDGHRNHTQSMAREKDKIREKYKNLTNDYKEPKVSIPFDELGITRLFVDEAHNYKNVPVETQIDRVLGISRTGSAKCRNMLEKVRYVQKTNNGGGVVMATGTPITNSITDVYIMQQYLQEGELSLLDIQNFDSWIGMFAEKETQFEIDVDTSSYRLATRFSKFHNLPELTTLLSSIADFHQVDEQNELPNFNGYSDIIIPKSDDLTEYLKTISERADAVRNGKVKRKEDNMLCITTDGRLAALDIRLVNDKATFSYVSKVMYCAENIWKIYTENHKDKRSQLIFSDISTPKETFNIYDELKSLLVKMGIPSEEIAFIHDATTESKIESLFKKVRKGEIRILLGSTSKLGMGVNVQDNLIALHHLSVPWRPADMTQREGRILRVGNTNKEVYIYRYITEGSFDAYSWQLLETKQRFISALLSGSLSDREGTDIDDTVLNYAEVKALAIGNPLIKKRVEVANDLSRYLQLQRKFLESKEVLSAELAEIPTKEERFRELISQAEQDRNFYNSNKIEYDKEFRKDFREKLFAEVKGYILKDEEKVFGSYQGFDIVLPSNMLPQKLYVIIKRSGKYYVDFGDADRGSLIRIDNLLDNFDERISRLNDSLSDQIRRKLTIEEELKKNDGYSENIENCKKELEEIDEKLGVNNNG